MRRTAGESLTLIVLNQALPVRIPAETPAPEIERQKLVTGGSPICMSSNAVQKWGLRCNTSGVHSSVIS